MSHESENDSKCYLVHVTKAIVRLSQGNLLAQGIDDNVHEYVRKEF